ncbi:hypothetical protein EJ05DRAFT_269307 [Pseudovirgaria hyperparasitica]|uniref:Uncharacterized protein n=1 Tax=Pseudovirgaria hyperparasitica TaxID=470096 RepID=A0A6A6VRA4_9PEZI|nr:uncharacterized protein EJ05DRAFT_269307 [Pseudovirgaria hyperparasitica]KAF2752675.1 hypothetical protein EJ05DRAFT_269307 [Pseudovirgaria hyperparasitica]
MVSPLRPNRQSTSTFTIKTPSLSPSSFFLLSLFSLFLSLRPCPSHLLQLLSLGLNESSIRHFCKPRRRLIAALPPFALSFHSYSGTDVQLFVP